MLPALYRPVTRRLSTFDSLFDNVFGDSWYHDREFNINPTISKTSRWSYKENEDEYILETSLPEGIDVTNIKAEVRNGMLKILVPKPEAKVIEITEASTEDVESAA